jgi:hypothetical protein
MRLLAACEWIRTVNEAIEIGIWRCWPQTLRRKSRQNHQLLFPAKIICSRLFPLPVSRQDERANSTFQNRIVYRLSSIVSRVSLAVSRRWRVMGDKYLADSRMEEAGGSIVNK